MTYTQYFRNKIYQFILLTRKKKKKTKFIETILGQIYFQNYAELINYFYLFLLRCLVLFLFIPCLQLLLCRERICTSICQNPRVMVLTLPVYCDHHYVHSRKDYKQCIVIEDNPLCFNTHNKTSRLLRQHITTV